VVLWERGNYKQTREMSGAYGNFVRAQEHTDLAFWTDNASSRFAATLKGPVALQTPIIDEGLIKDFEIRSVASAAFSGTLCGGRLFILDRASWSDFQLHLIEITASRLANALDRQIMQNEAKLAAAERERARLTRDLHDGLLQSLTAAGLQMKLLADGQKEETRSRLEVIRQLLVGEQRRIRDFMRKTPPRGDGETEVPLAISLQEVLVEIARHWDCAASLTIEPPEATATATLCVHLSLMLAEAVANAVRHGNAATVRVMIQKSHQELKVMVHDDGRGFAGGATFAYKGEDLTAAGLGPFSLHGRIRELGGILAVKSSPAGVDLQIELPLT
jgi:signal transduction histidine kinase